MRLRCVGVFLIVLFFEQAATAKEDPSFCTSLQQLSSLDYCFQNPTFVEHADLCLEKFDKEVDAKKRQLASAFSQRDAESTSAQQAKFKNTSQDLTATDEGFKSLLVNGRKARSELQSYLASLIYTGHPVVGFLVQHGLLGARQADPCWRDSYQKLVNRIAKLDTKLRELENADKQTTALLHLNEGRKSSLDLGTDSLRKPAASTFGAGAGSAAFSGKQKRSASTITGKIPPKTK